ncbi:MAG: histidine kinase [Ideonella sp.]|nr:histidine kinase [Ideonella sp.]
MRRPWYGQLAVEAAIGVPLCVFIGAFITLVTKDLGSPGVGRLLALNVGYSLCIGLSIQALIETGRFALSRWIAASRPDDDAAQRDWPGWSWMVPWTLLSTVTGYLGGAALGDALFAGTHLDAVLGGHLQPIAVLFVITLLASFLTVMFFHARGALAATEAAVRDAERLAAENRLRLLQSQLEPHMLFNTLANLRVLVAVDPPRAQAMLDHLIGFLRSTLAASRRGHHRLADEFARTQDYLELMKVRMGPRLEWSCRLPSELAEQPVPALLLQPLVENAIAHGLEPAVAGGRLLVEARLEGDQLVLSVRDTGIGLTAHAAPRSDDRPDERGFGLRQVRERLEALYGGRASFALVPAGDDAGGAVATLRLPLQAPLQTAPPPGDAAPDRSAPTPESAAPPPTRGRVEASPLTGSPR